MRSNWGGIWSSQINKVYHKASLLKKKKKSDVGAQTDQLNAMENPEERKIHMKI